MFVFVSYSVCYACLHLHFVDLFKGLIEFFSKHIMLIWYHWELWKVSKTWVRYNCWDFHSVLTKQFNLMWKKEISSWWTSDKINVCHSSFKHLHIISIAFPNTKMTVIEHDIVYLWWLPCENPIMRSAHICVEGISPSMPTCKSFSSSNNDHNSNLILYQMKTWLIMPVSSARQRLLITIVSLWP